MDFRRLRQVCKYGWKDASSISHEEGVKKGKLGVFLDILHCYLRYNVWSNQYKKEKLYSIQGEERIAVCLKYQEKNTKRDKWVKEFFDNYKFLNKWSSLKYEGSAFLQKKRNDAYNKHFGLQYPCFFEYGVIMQRHHYVDAVLRVGKKCRILANVNIDYTGGLTLGYKVSISEGVKILTHNHVTDFSGVSEDKGCILTPLVIQDRVWIGTRAMIMPGVREIGRGAMISSCAYVHTKVPPYAIVMGNPAKVVGFRFSPEDTIEFEKNNYPEEDRLPEEVIINNYNKYFQNRWKELKEFARI